MSVKRRRNPRAERLRRALERRQVHVAHVGDQRLQQVGQAEHDVPADQHPGLAQMGQRVGGEDQHQPEGEHDRRRRDRQQVRDACREPHPARCGGGDRIGERRAEHRADHHRPRPPPAAR
jgi:hypothetical protein